MGSRSGPRLSENAFRQKVVQVGVPHHGTLQSAYCGKEVLTSTQQPPPRVFAINFKQGALPWEIGFSRWTWCHRKFRYRAPQCDPEARFNYGICLPFFFSVWCVLPFVEYIYVYIYISRLERVVADFNTTSASDIFVVNFGAHYHATPEGDAKFRAYMAPILDDMARLGETATVMWRCVNLAGLSSFSTIDNTKCCTTLI